MRTIMQFDLMPNIGYAVRTAFVGDAGDELPGAFRIVVEEEARQKSRNPKGPPKVKVSNYLFDQLDGDHGPNRAFAFSNQDEEAEIYETRIGRDFNCQCAGFTAGGNICKHYQMALAIHERQVAAIILLAIMAISANSDNPVDGTPLAR